MVTLVPSAPVESNGESQVSRANAPAGAAVGRRWQFSLRSIGLVALLAGPAAGAWAGTFGAAVREVLALMLVVLSASAVLALVSAVLAFIILSPLFILEHRLRSTPPSHAPRPERGPSIV